MNTMHSNLNTIVNSLISLKWLPNVASRILITIAMFIMTELVAFAQCPTISFTLEELDPCCYKVQLNNTSECTPQISFVLDGGQFLNAVGNSGSGYTASLQSQTEITVTHNNGAIPFGSGSPLEFCIETSSAPTLSILYDVTCGLGESCFADFPLSGCESQDSCEIDFAFTILSNCGLFQFTNFSTGQHPISYSWNFGDQNSGNNNFSTLQNPTHQFSTLCTKYNVCLTIIDGNKCSKTTCIDLPILELDPPTITCPNDIVLTCESNTNPSKTGFATAIDNCDPKPIIYFIDEEMGTSPCDYKIYRTWYAKDKCGQINSCVQVISVLDNTAPSIVCPPDIVIPGNPSIGGAQIILPPPTVLTDNCLGVNYITDHANGLFPCGTTTMVTYTAIDRCGNTKTCSMNVTVENCEPSPGDPCCAFSIQLVNNYTDDRIKKVKLSGLCDTQICCADPDEWAQESNYPNSITWYPGNNLPIPSGNAIDNDFMLYISEPGVNYFQVEWLNASDNVVCKHIIQISCDGDYDEDEDWTLYTSTTEIDDPNLFVFAVREESEDDESPCDLEEREIIDCTFLWNISCSSPNYLVTLTGPPGYSNYEWQIVQGPTNPLIGNSQNPTFLGIPGSYVITMQASGGGPDTCIAEEEIIISMVNPDFTYKFSSCPNNTTATFTATGCESGCSYSWASTASGFPSSGSNITYAFPQQNNTYPITMTLTDPYGCQHIVKKDIIVDLNCNAAFQVEKFIFCPEDCVASTESVAVTFSNNSTGGKCPVSYKWDFGDGNSFTSTNTNNVNHSYNVPCPGGDQYVVTLTATDADGNKCTATQVADITACEVDFTYHICPDGKVIFTGNRKGKWSFPGSHSIAPWPYSDFPDTDGNREQVVVRYDVSGTYSVSFTGKCDNGGECTIVKDSIVIEIQCCAKNDRQHSNLIFNSTSGSQYKMKYRFAQNQLPFFHNIIAKTKLRKQITKHGIKYYKNWNADEIEASFSGTIYKRDADKCNCAVPEIVPATSTELQNVKKVKARLGYSQTRFRSRQNTLTSTHRVEIESTSVTKNLNLGKDCDRFRWWLDWF